MSDTTATKFAVARKSTIITGLRDDVEQAKSDLTGVLETADSIGIKDTARLVQVDITTTQSDLVDYVAPEPTVGPEVEVEPTADEVPAQ